MTLNYVRFKNYTCVITDYLASPLSHFNEFVEIIFCNTIIVMKIKLRFYRESLYTILSYNKTIKIKISETGIDDYRISKVQSRSQL